MMVQLSEHFCNQFIKGLWMKWFIAVVEWRGDKHFMWRHTRKLDRHQKFFEGKVHLGSFWTFELMERILMTNDKKMQVEGVETSKVHIFTSAIHVLKILTAFCNPKRYLGPLWWLILVVLIIFPNFHIKWNSGLSGMYARHARSLFGTNLVCLNSPI